jgi:5-aminolevulinate synthase
VWAPAPAAPATSPAPSSAGRARGELADLHGKEAALVFTSGYVSNQTGISTIAKLMPNCLILSDAAEPQSMIEGIRQSGCERAIFRHNDLAHLEELLKAAGPTGRS